MMQHHRGQDSIKRPIRERHFLGDRIFEGNLDAGPLCFHARPRNHLRRCVDSIDSACRSDASLGGDGQRPCSAAYIQD